MRHYLIQTGGGSAVPFLTRLASRLPEGFADRPDVTLKNLGPPSDDGTDPRVVVMFDETDENGESLSAFKEAIDGLRNERFMLSPHPPALAPPAANETEDDALESLILLLRLPKTANADDPFPDLKKIFETQASGEDFPEDQYEGGAAKAYAHICKKLGTEPKEDRGVTIKPERIRNMKRPWRIKARDWDPVVEHLETEILFFGFTREWLGDSGHLMMLNDRQTDLNFGFLELLGGTYLGMKSSAKVTLIIGTMWKLAGFASSAVGGPAGKAAGLLRALWDVTAAGLPDPTAKTTATIAGMKGELTKLWSAQLTMLGKQHAKINGDWGLLNRFGGLIMSKKLDWPEDFSPITREFSRAFHIYALQKTMRKAEVGAEMVIKEEVPCQKPRNKAGWWLRCPRSGGRDCTYRWALKSKKYKTGHWCFVYYLGYKSHDPLSRRDSYIPADGPIQRKLFGDRTESILDPELGFPHRFLTDPNCAERKGWGLEQRVL
ncbi:hypothetical protein K1T73_02490 [Roseovarius sp. SCSIO 43702]|uniref:hypothetical protein n=1 Tax=Roseovarius sp. SCSIO 43702 TaxID=2823043 RepID=UPI001C73ACFF|nr:hypothetical protein [Roseovarius sp. SCSIO 43702]QYX57295.1 hypothetical protein K1T73_02490 [Roseovarius sp. SCSIO 43702]